MGFFLILDGAANSSAALFMVASQLY